MNLKRGLYIVKDEKKYEILKLSRVKDTILLQPENEKQKVEFTLSNVLKSIDLGKTVILKPEKKIKDSE